MMVQQGNGDTTVLDQQGSVAPDGQGGAVIQYADDSGSTAQVNLSDPQAPSVGDSLDFQRSDGLTASLTLQDAVPTTQGAELSFGGGDGSQAMATVIIIVPPNTNDYNYWPFYDANGNVTELIDSADGSVAAHYEYEPYGAVLTQSGPYASA